jgi:uncharacterized metal-binding protein YceD (DUF177 family)
MTRSIPPSGPLSRRFDAASARDTATSFALDTTPAERDALARDCDLPGIDALSAAFRIRREGADGLHVTGTVSARVRQVCVVSLDEFASDVSEPVDVRFAPEAEVEELAAARAARPGGDDEDLEDLPDPIVNGRVDLGSLAAEILVRGLDPYPRKPGVAFADPAPEPAEEPEASPFAALKALKGPETA